MKFNTETHHQFSDYARLVFDQTKLGVVCRFMAPDGSWEVHTETLGGKFVGMLVAFNSAQAAAIARQQLSSWGEIKTGFNPLYHAGTYFTVMLPR